ncbi:expansin EXLX1 family cellulose-binding protein [Micromonospora sp. NPDC126480]|uniref:expansin EXLX1 family cellulose-binding protein n=1 Tax=Micromonospora sp. NPDC126480 TaxID=3155312 RepID=UPI0033225CD9
MTDASTHPPATGRPLRRSRRGRWLAAVGAALLAGALGLTLTLRAGAVPACAAPLRDGLAPPAAGVPNKGKATFYDSKGAGGNCSYPAAPADRRYVALGPSEYAAGAACGGHLDVTGPKGTVRVLVMDQCPECPPGHIDLSREAFARIADPVQGVVPVTYRAVADPPLPGPLTFRIKEGSSRWWFAVLVADHGNPLRAVEVRQGGRWRAADRQDYNYWVVPDGAGPGPYTIRVTDTRGHRVTAAGIRLAPGKVQRADVRMYGRSSATRSPAASRPSTPRPTVVSAAPTPSAVATTTGSAALAPAAASTPGCGD